MTVQDQARHSVTTLTAFSSMYFLSCFIGMAQNDQTRHPVCGINDVGSHNVEGKAAALN
jgi:hypothetical protein